MPIVRSQRVFLDTWTLKQFAKGNWSQETLCELTDRLRSGCWRVVVTPDHVFDYCSGQLSQEAVRETRLVCSKLKPLWMLSGGCVYLFEANREYCRLKGHDIPNEPVPCEDLCEVLTQIPLDDRASAALKELRKTGAPVRLDDVVQAWYTLDDEERRRLTEELKATFQANRVWARDAGVDWDEYARSLWCKHVSQCADGQGNEQPPPWNAVDVRGMPAWRIRLAVERVWHRNPSRKPKPGDFADMNHLGLLHYVDAFVTERDLAGMIREAGLTDYASRLFTNVPAWLSGTRGLWGLRGHET